MSLQNPLARARGLGSAKEGTHHWWLQRLTSVLLVPLCLWFITSLVQISTMDHANISIWLQSPIVCILMLMLLLALYYHAALGVQVVIEDYIESEWQKIASIMLVKFLALLTGLASVLSVMKIFLGL